MDIRTHDNLRLHVEIHGQGAPVLYLHGGPGAGCFGFAEYQADRLGIRFQLICLDQRGVHRSEPLGTHGCTPADLVADCESVRTALGLERWTLYGHGHGALTALRYAAGYPDRVQALVLENPVLDPVAAAHSLAEAAADLLVQLGRHDLAQQARAAAGDTSGSQREVYARCWVQTDLLGAERHSLFFQAIDPDGYQELLEYAEITPAHLAAAEQHVQALLASSAFYANLEPLLAQITVPVLVTRGRFDAICSPDTVQRLRQGLPAQRPPAEVLTFPAACHYPHIEEANRYAQLVGNWLQKVFS